MANLGQYNSLTVVKRVAFGAYLDGGRDGEILLPQRYVPEHCQPGDHIEVFIYRDSEDLLVATTRRPRIKAGEFAHLKVKSINHVGAFLDWGLEKDLLVPFNQQKRPMREGQSYIVHCYIDPRTNRLAASSKIDRFLDKRPAHYKPGEQVHLLIAEHTDLGYKAIINNSHWGVLFDNEVFKPLRYGQRIKGYIKKLRANQKIDLSLQAIGYSKVDSLSKRILERLQDNQGFLPVTDRSPPEQINALFSSSKKAYKMAVGKLYKQRLIIIEANGIRLNPDKK